MINPKPIWYFSVMSSNRGDQAIRAGMTAKLKTSTEAPIAYFSCRNDLLDTNRIEQLNKEASMLLVAGSGLYSNYDLESGFYFRCNPKDIPLIEVPVAFYSIGMNNHLEMDRFGLLKEKTLESIRRFNMVASHSSARDFRTLDMLYKIGIKKAKFAPDPAIFCPSKPFHIEEDKKMVGLNIAQHADMLKHYRSNLVEIFGEICRYLDGEGYKPVFIAHDALEHNIYEDLVREFKGLMYYNRDGVEEMMSLYRMLDFTVGVRCHSNIMSFGAETPFICLAYDQKQVEFCKVVNMSPYLLRISQNIAIDQVLDKIDHIREDSEELRFVMKERKEELWKIHQELIDEIVEMIN